MGFKRDTSPPDLRGQALTEAMVGIGMLFAEKAAPEPNIEDTLVAASVEGMDRDDLRGLAILVTWIGVHQRWINADRLIRAVESQASTRVRAFWAAVAKWLVKDRRFARLERLHLGARVDLLRAGSDFQIKRNGEDPRFAGSALRVPAGILRDRARDVLRPTELAQRHGTYSHRVLMGPSYRADMWAALEREPELSNADLARATYGSFATAWQVRRDRGVLGNGAMGGDRAFLLRAECPKLDLEKRGVQGLGKDEDTSSSAAVAPLTMATCRSPLSRPNQGYVCWFDRGKPTQ